MAEKIFLDSFSENGNLTFYVFLFVCFNGTAVHIF